ASLGAVHPSRPLTLETPRASSQRTADIQRVVDLVCPFGFGQRALIVSPPKAGKTMMLQAIAEAVAENHPQALLLILLVDERREELLADARTLEAKHKLRRALVDLPPEQAMQNLLQQMKRAKTNAELLNAL